MNNSIGRLARMPSVHLLLLVVIGVSLYITTLPYPFVFDDRVLLMNNPLIKQINGFFDLFDIDDFVPTYLPRLDDPDMVTSFALRPFAYMSFRLNYMLGGFNPAGFRSLNIAIHIANAVMFYQLLLGVVRRRVEGDRLHEYLVIPLFSSLIFLVHPLQTESVTYITQRFTSLGTFFYIATLLLYLHSSGSGSVISKKVAYLGSLVTLVMGMQTKEFVFTAPFTLIMLESILLRHSLRPTLRRLIPHLACLAIIPTLIFVMAQDLSHKTVSVGSAAKILNFAGYSRAEYAITQIRAILSYFRLLVLPYNQNFDPDFPLYQSIFHPEIVVALLIWILFITAGIVLLRRGNKNLSDDLVAFSIFWFPLLLCVSSSIVPLPDLMSEHRSYLPSLAFCTGLVTHVNSLRLRYPPAWSARIIMGLCLVSALFCLLTIQRNNIYSSRLSLWSDTASKSPNKARPALALGNIYEEMRQYEDAISWLNKSIDLNPHYIEPYLSLGSLYQDLSMQSDAINLYEKYLASNAPNLRVLANLALAYQEANMPLVAIDALKRALVLDPTDETLNLILAEHLYLLNRNIDARRYLAKARERDKANPLNDISAAIKMLEEYYDKSGTVGNKNIGRVRS